MASVKILVLLILVTATCCNATFGKGFFGISGKLGFIFGKFNPSYKVCEKKAYTCIKRHKQPKSLDESLIFITRLTQVLGGVFETKFKGLGAIYIRLVIALSRISICKFRPRKWKRIPRLCSRDFPLFGVKGCGTSVSSIIERFDLLNCEERVLTLINQYTEGEGYESCEGTKRIFFENCLDLARIIDRPSSLSYNIFSTVIVKVFIVLAGFGNGLRPNYGIGFCVPLIKYIHPFVVEIGLPGIISQTTIIRERAEICNNNGGEFTGLDIDFDNVDESDDWGSVDDNYPATDTSPTASPTPKPGDDCGCN